MCVGPDDVLATTGLDFDDGTAAADAGAAVAAVEQQVGLHCPTIKRLFIEVAAVPAQLRWSRPDSTLAQTASPRAQPGRSRLPCLRRTIR